MGGGSYVKAYQLPAVASWEIDLFGKILNTKTWTEKLLMNKASMRNRQYVHRLSVA